MNNLVFGSSLPFHQLSIAIKMVFKSLVEPILLVARFGCLLANSINRFIVLLPFNIPRVDELRVLSLHDGSPSHLGLVEM